MINLVKKFILSNSREEITLFKDQPLILRSLNAFPQDEEINSCIFVLCNNAYKPTPINHVVDIKKFLLRPASFSCYWTLIHVMSYHGLIRNLTSPLCMEFNI